MLSRKRVNANESATDHAGDCTIYASLSNSRPIDGICTCGYGWRRVRVGDWSEMYSKERLEMLSRSQGQQNGGHIDESME